MKRILFASVLVISLNLFASNELNKIIGTNDLVTVAPQGQNIPLKYRGLIDAFGKLSMGCTATHIGSGYVLTAGHCFYAGPTPTEDAECSDITIDWGYREGVEPYLKSQCQRIIIAQRSDKGDFAVIRVSPVPPVFIAPEMKRKAVSGDTVTIFSHPEELPLRWSRLCGVELRQHPFLPKQAINHKCDTNPGSSGATIINAITLKVVGIHDGGVAANTSDDNTVGGSDDLNPVRTGMNYGTYIQNSSLYSVLVSLGFNQ